VGYWVDYCINLRVIIPQQCERIYIVGFCNDFSKKAHDLFEWPKFPIFPRTVKDLLEENLDSDDSSYILSEKLWENITRTEEYKRNLLSRLVHVDGCACTLMSHYKKSCCRYSEFVPRLGKIKLRFFTPRECACLQGFPEWFNLGGCLQKNQLYYQLGNSVCPVIVAAIGESILRVLEGRTRDGHSDMKSAMELLLMSVPDPEKSLGATPKKSLREYIVDFLGDHPENVDIYSGRGPTKR